MANDRAMRALEEKVQGSKAALDTKVKMRDECHARFVRFQLCLSILLDDKYTLLVTQGDSIVWAFLEDYKSKDVTFEGNDSGSNTLDQIKELVDVFQHLPRDLPSTVAGLSKALYGGEEYYEGNGSAVEKAIDGCIGAHIPHEGGISSAPSDYCTLLSYLDRM